MDLQKAKPLTTFRDNKLNHQIISGLKDKKVLVTGATGGIGICLVQMFAKEGATLGIHYHQNLEQAKSLSRDIEVGGGRAKSLLNDLVALIF